MQRFGHLPIRARTTRFTEKPKNSFVDSIEDSGLRQGLSRKLGVRGSWEHRSAFLDSVSPKFFSGNFLSG
jgi:hypothetical protein